MKFQKICFTALGLLLVATFITPAFAATFPITQTFSGSKPGDWELRSSAAWNTTVSGDQTLRLTSAGTAQSGLGFYNDSFSSTLGIVAQFRYYDGGGNGADGLSFFLVDGDQVDETNIAAGAAGGALGYAQETTGGTPGIPHAYLGVGFDEWGNYISVEDSGFPTTPDTVVLRGAGNGLIGYPYLTHTNVSSAFGQSIDGGWRTARVTVTPGSGNATIRVEMSWDEGATWNTVINDYVYNVAPPTNLKLGFAASTGGSTNIHAIGNLEVILPVDLRTQVTVPPSGTYHRGDAFTYTYTVTNLSANSSSDTTITNSIPVGTLGIDNITWNLTSTAGGSASGTGADIGTIHRAIPGGATVTVVVSGTVGADILSTTNLNHTISAVPESTVKDPSTANAIASISVTTSAPTPAQASLTKILAYASSHGTTTVPTLTDYTNAGITGVTSDELSNINIILAASNATTQGQVQAAIDAMFNGVLPVANAGNTVGSAVVTMSSNNLRVGETATVTFIFPTAPTDFTVGDITAENGTISNLAVTGDPKVYTATFTPTAAIAIVNNTISVRSKVAITKYTGGSGTDVSFDGVNMWVSNGYGDVVRKVTPSGVITNYTGTGAQPFSIAFDGTNMWTGNNAGNSVSKVTLGGAVTNYSSIGQNVFGIAFDGTNMWTSNYGDNSVSKVAPNGTKTTYTGTGAGPWGIAFDGTNMWTANSDGSSVTKITPSGVMTTYSLPSTSYPIGIAFDGTNMWTGNVGTSTVSKISPAGIVTTYDAPSSPYGLAFDGTNMWSANYGADSVSKITPTGVVTEYSGVGSNPRDLAFDGTNLWAVNVGSDDIAKIVPMNGGTSANYSIDTVVIPTLTNGGMVPVEFLNSSVTPSIPTPPIASIQTTSAPKTPSLPVRDLRSGMSGEDVKALQSVLIAQGYSLSAGITGYFGSQTKAALIRYQTKNKITPASGYLGAKTRNHMKSTQLAALWW